jgi:hypothetical protein
MNDIHPKVSIPVMAGALVGVGMYECKRHGIEIDAVEGGFITTIVMGMLGFIVPSNDQPDVVSVPPGSTALVETPAVAVAPQTSVIRERADDDLGIPPQPVPQHPTV